MIDDLAYFEMNPEQLVSLFRTARRGPACVVLEGFHAIKHALRFGAEMQLILCADPTLLEGLIESHAYDLSDGFHASPRLYVARDVYQRCVPHPHATGLVAIAKRPVTCEVTQLREDRPCVLVENARHAGNLGATIRVAAAADAACVIALGELDPWNPSVVRGAAGLHFALPVLHYTSAEALDRFVHRPLIAMTTEVCPLSRQVPSSLSGIAPIVAFGTERDGLSQELLLRADHYLALPLREGVSSLNLATAVAAYLYGSHR